MNSAIAQVSGLDLLLHYPFEGYDVDASGNGRNSQTSNTWYETGANGVANYAIAVDGDSSSTIFYDYTSDWSAFNFQDFTVSAWVRFDDLSNTYSNIFEMGYGQVFLRLLNQGGSARPEFGIFTASGNWVGSNYVPGQLLDFWQNWHHLTLTSSMNGAQRTFKLYIDGVLYHTENFSGNSFLDATINHNAPGNGSTTVNIGFRPWDPSFSTNGSFQHVFLYGRSISDSEVTDLYEYLCYPSYSTIDAEVCDSYTLNGLNYYYSGVYTQSIQKPDGCDSIITLNLIVHETPYAEVIQNEGYLESSYTAEMYQWVDCLNQTVIPNSNNQQFIPTSNGSFAVILLNGSNGMCYSASDCFDFTLTLDEQTLTGVSLYPNPATESVHISGLKDEAVVVIVDGTGRMITQHQVKSSEQSISLVELAAGSYTVVIQSNGKVLRQPLQITK